jgi:hypothetical protein
MLFRGDEFIPVERAMKFVGLKRKAVKYRQKLMMRYGV